MSKRFKITKNYYREDEFIYNKSYVTLEPGFTVLVGCNGSGKTTLLKQIKHSCYSQNIPVLSFDNQHEGGSNAISLAGFMGDFNALANGIMSSEGENISQNIGKFARKIGQFVRSNADANQIFILFDAIDSGWSVDNILEFKADLIKTILDDNKQEMYIIVSANEYEMARSEKCFDVSECRYVKIENYDEYRDLVIKTRKKKNKRYGFEEFTLS